MTSYMNMFTLKRFYASQGFRKYKNEDSSPSNSIVIESERFYMASADSNSNTSGSNLVKNVTTVFSSK